MSEDQIDIELVERNYKAFARYAHPAAAQRLRDHKPLSKLVRNEDGDWDVEFRGELLYGTGGRARAEKMAEDVRNNPHCRFKLYPMATRSLDRAAGEYLFHLMKHATDDGITFQDIPTTPEGYHLISFGLGLGYHLPNLVEMTKCECLTIVETNMDFLYHSMAVMDWTPMLERNKGWPFVAMLTDPNGISEAVRAHCRLNNPTSVDWGLVISAYHNDTMVQAIRELQRDAAMIMMGLGFLVDEAEMARASYLNLCQGADYRLFKKREARANVPAFIVGFCAFMAINSLARSRTQVLDFPEPGRPITQESAWIGRYPAMGPEPPGKEGRPWTLRRPTAPRSHSPRALAWAWTTACSKRSWTPCPTR